MDAESITALRIRDVQTRNGRLSVGCSALLQSLAENAIVAREDVFLEQPKVTHN